MRFNSHDDAVKHLKKRPGVGTLALITTIKDGVDKHRLTLGCRVSGSNAKTVKSERGLSPKAWAVIRGVLELQSLCINDESLELFVLDYSDAFHMLPLDFDEQPFVQQRFVVKVFVWGVLRRAS